jgi:hypothetical protein
MNVLYSTNGSSYTTYNEFTTNPNSYNHDKVPDDIGNNVSEYIIDENTQYIKFKFNSDSSVTRPGWKIHVKFKNSIQNDWTDTSGATNSLFYLSTIPNDISNQIPDVKHKLITSGNNSDIILNTSLSNVNYALDGTNNINCTQSIPFTSSVLSYKLQDLSNNYNYQLNAYNSNNQELTSYWDISSNQITYDGDNIIDGSYVIV